MEHPIIYSTEMVRAYLEGRKTMTRRVIKPQPYWEELIGGWSWIRGSYWHKTHAMAQFQNPNEATQRMAKFCPYGQVGDRLWVRETFCDICSWRDGQPDVCYKEDCETNPSVVQCDEKWKPSIHMPRWASRLTQTITGIRVERLQDISSWDCEREGCPFEIDRSDPAKEVCDSELAIEWFRILWDSINAKRGYPWESNCWVWVITYPRYEG